MTASPLVDSSQATSTSIRKPNIAPNKTVPSRRGGSHVDSPTGEIRVSGFGSPEDSQHLVHRQLRST